MNDSIIYSIKVNSKGHKRTKTHIRSHMMNLVSEIEISATTDSKAWRNKKQSNTQVRRRGSVRFDEDAAGSGAAVDWSVVIFDGWWRNCHLVRFRPYWETEIHGGIRISMDWSTRTHWSRLMIWRECDHEMEGLRNGVLEREVEKEEEEKWEREGRLLALCWEEVEKL